MEIGSKIREIRLKKGITMAELCEGTGLSKGFISQVENNKTSPSIATAQIIASFLQVPVAYLLLKKENQVKVTKKKDRMFQYRGDKQYMIEFIAEMDELYLKIATLPVNESSIDRLHEGIECHLVIEGTIEISYGEEKMIVEEGDSFSWHSCVPHRLTNIGEKEARILVASYKENKS